MSKKGIRAVIIFCIMIVLFGFVTITAGLPKYIKDKSNFKINYTVSPFDFTVDVGEYSLCLNNKIVYNFENGSKQVINIVGEKVHSSTSYIINNTSETFKNLESKLPK
ncbi:hypothetical protein [Clostridium ljungdahlii]|uniref:hypothetical protein n=1 Tax=Clostridium ljungdahlii TaxID=1538 RepID=UPI00386879E2